MNYRSWCRILVPCAFYLMLIRPVSGATFIVTTNADAGAGSLRQAILAANSLPGQDVIVFNIAGSGVQTIAPATALPSVNDSVSIDGTTQPGYSGKPRIVINGSRGALPYGLVIFADRCSIRALAIGGCPGAGISVLGTSNIVAGCFLGTDAEGIVSRANGIGILVSSTARFTLIGGTSVAERNVISGNADLGICLSYSDAHTIQGNFIGTDASGTAALANGNDGVSVDHASDSNIGGSLPGEGNVISGNGRSGIRIIGSPAAGNVIQGNLVGTDVGGTSSLGNHGAGITILDAAQNTIGGTEPGAGNLVSANGENGIVIQDPQAMGNVIQGNIIGLDTSGARHLANYLNGVAVANASETTIGGTETGAGNVISGNRLYGISLNGSNDVVQGNFIGTDTTGNRAMPNGLDALSGGGILIRGNSESLGGDSESARNLISGNHHDGVRMEGARECVVQANWIGLNISGKGLGNDDNGIVMNAARANTIGGSEPGSGNICAGNGLAGILLSAGSDSNVLLGNFIGTDRGGLRVAGNGGAGIEIAESSDNQIGGLRVGEANRMAFNSGNGVLVRGDGTAGITISGNSIFANKGHAINLQPTGEKPNTITPNDVLDGDVGPNHLQNAPVITNAAYVFGLTIVSGSLKSKADSQFQIELFWNDPYGGYLFGEGQTYAGATSVSTDSNGLGQFQITLAGDFRNQLFSATAMDGDTGDTSEFSAAVPVLKGALRIVDLRRSGANVLISFTTETNTQYRVDWGAGLPVSKWNTGTSIVAGTGNLVTVSEAIASNPRFYRVVALP